MTLPKYHSFPPLTPHKPTPTIPQVEDKHQSQVFTDKVECVVNTVLAIAVIIFAAVFVGGLMYKTFVWGY
jgi:hypothetical protein